MILDHGHRLSQGVLSAVAPSSESAEDGGPPREMIGICASLMTKWMTAWKKPAVVEFGLESRNDALADLLGSCRT